MKKETEKKTINLYIACSTKSDVFMGPKDSIDKLKNKLNFEYAKQDKDIEINVIAYDDPECRNEVFRDFIKKNANLVVFLIEEEIDERQENILKEELKYADEVFKEKGRPHILIYSIKDKLPKNLEKVIKEKKLNFDRVAYNKEEKFSEMIENNIISYIDAYSIFNEIQNFARKKRKTFIISIIVIIVVIIGASIGYDYWSQNRLLLAGGGSVKNYIKEKCGIDIISEKPAFWIYAPMPSSYSWTLLREEAMKDDKDRKYYPICLSADEAKDSVFLGNMDSETFIEKGGVVVSVLIGYDTLVAYCNSLYIDSILREELINKTCDSLYLLTQHDKVIYSIFHDDLNTIRGSKLESLIRHDKNIKLYATSQKSGTRNAYIDTNKANIKSLTNDTLIFGKDTNNIDLFTDINTIDSSSNYIVLGSKYYKPLYGLSQAKSLTIVNTNRKPILKPIYLYFIAYRKSNGEYEIKEEIAEFFKEIGRPINDSLKKKIEKAESYIVKDTILGDKK